MDNFLYLFYIKFMINSAKNILCFYLNLISQKEINKICISEKRFNLKNFYVYFEIDDIVHFVEFEQKGL